jgi:hypothetical protein
LPFLDVGSLKAWNDNDHPDDHLFRLVTEWIINLADKPWQAPSVPLSFAEGQPDEIRMAVVPDTNVRVFYEHRHVDGAVTLLRVAAEHGVN